MSELTRDRVIAAFLTITADRGLDQATMREVAKEAGLSVGSVQYYCHTKDDLLMIAHQHVVDQIIARAETLPRTGHVGSAIRAYATEFLPLDEARAAEQRIYLAFAARAAVTPALARIQHGLTSRLRTDCAEAFRLAHERGEAIGDFDPDTAARATIATLDGLMLYMLTDPEGMPAQAAIEAFDAHLSRFVDITDPDSP